MKSGYLFRLFFIFFPLISRSQPGAIEGFVSDAELNVPLSGASVVLSGNKGNHTDLFGRFAIPAVEPGHYELVLSHISYKTEIVAVEVRSNMVSAVRVSLKKSSLSLDEVKVNAGRSSALNSIGAVDILLRPVKNSQDLLRLVPGVFIAQHAGGGKAEQIFLRGYDLDHGTDIHITADGFPVNMVSHAHGQGYADLHFIIPETVEKIVFDKGPYAAHAGNMATAGYVEFRTKEFLDNHSLKLELGDFNTWRTLAMLKLFNKSTADNRQQLYIASEYLNTRGYFESPQHFHRFNMMGKYNSWWGNQTQFSVTASTFSSRWNASGQIPDRAVRKGIISRFGSIDDTEGGNTSRTNIGMRVAGLLKNNWSTQQHIYLSRYRFNLFSNFTFFLNDPVLGDQIQQLENRTLFGYAGSFSKSWIAGKQQMVSVAAAGFRHDDIRNNELAHTQKRKFLESVQLGNIKESNFFLYGTQTMMLNDQWDICAGVRFDFFRFGYLDKLTGGGGFSFRKRFLFSPKLNITHTLSQHMKIYLQTGAGFHSNDSRVILNREADRMVPKVYGGDLGVVFKPRKNLLLKSAIWYLFSEQEFLYVGDEGVVEPGGRTARKGLDLSVRYQFTAHLFGDIDVNYSHARSVDNPKGENFIPLAPVFTSAGGLTLKMTNGISGSVRCRYLGARPATEDNSVRTESSFLTDILLSYSLKNFELVLSAENLFNQNHKEAQFYTESRLYNEPAPVSEIHFTPGSPRFIKSGIRFWF
jgi:outer membrane receptor protein involved in Fe transport